jgi:cyclase
MRRRDFVTSCASHLAAAAAASALTSRLAWAQRPSGAVIAAEPFGRLERVAEGIWALVSTPLDGDRTTVSNGGIIAGRNGVLAIEGFFQPAGAQWLAARARELTGRWPTHVVLTHYHADHTSGVAGYLTPDAHPSVRSTAATRDMARDRNQPADAARTAALADVVIVDAASRSTLDLGGRTVQLVPRRGHTASDVSLELDEPDVVFCGDLLWNAMFPNYVDAVPSQLRTSVRELRRGPRAVYVPGHGAIASDADYARYQALLDEVEQAARAAHAKGTSAADAGAAYQLPAAVGDWAMFSKAFFERAFGAWYRELGQA